MRIYELYKNIGQSNLPKEFENPEELYYFNTSRLIHVKESLIDLKQKSESSEISHSIDFQGNKSLPVHEIFEFIEKSISFSEEINKKREQQKDREEGKDNPSARLNLLNKLRKKD